jgi:hypothetical protein
MYSIISFSFCIYTILLTPPAPLYCAGAPKTACRAKNRHARRGENLRQAPAFFQRAAALEKNDARFKKIVALFEKIDALFEKIDVTFENFGAASFSKLYILYFYLFILPLHAQIL